MQTSNARFLGAITMAAAAGWWRIVLSGVSGIVLLLASGNVGATELGVNVEASKFITETVSAGREMLDDTRFDQAQGERLFEELIRQNVDFARAAKFVLGRYWGSATDMERQHFAEVYADYIARTYAKALPHFRGTTLEVVRTIEHGDEIEVKTLFNHDRASRPAVCSESAMYRNDPICRDANARWDVDWLLHRTDDAFKIVDVNVAGMSVLLNERDEFASILERAGVAGLTRIIEARLVGEPSS